MTAVAHARPTISPFAIANGTLDIHGHPVGLLAERAGAIHRKESRGHIFLVDGGLHHHSVPWETSRTEEASRVLRASASPRACAPRSTCSHVMPAFRVPKSATLWRSSRPAPTE